MDGIKKMYKAGVETIKNEDMNSQVTKILLAPFKNELITRRNLQTRCKLYRYQAWDIAVAAVRELGAEKPEDLLSLIIEINGNFKEIRLYLIIRT